MVEVEIKNSQEVRQLKQQLKAQKEDSDSSDAPSDDLSIKSTLSGYYNWAERELEQRKGTLQSGVPYSKQFDVEKKKK